MNKLLGFLSGDAGLYAAGALVAVLLAFGTAQTLRLSSARVTIAGLQRDAATSAARVDALTKKASEDARKVEAQRAGDMAENAKEIAREKLEFEKKLAAFAAESDAGFDSLRDYITAFAGRAGASSAGAKSGLSPADRAAALGRVLVRVEATTRAAERADAERLEGLATQVRGLQRAYKSLQDGEAAPKAAGSYWGTNGEHP